MPSMFSRSKKTVAKPVETISRPVLVKHPTIEEFRGEAPLMQIPKTPPPPPPIPGFVPGLSKQVIIAPAPVQRADTYSSIAKKPVYNSRFREHMQSPTHTYSSSVYSKDDDSSLSSTPMSSLSPGEDLSFRKVEHTATTANPLPAHTSIPLPQFPDGAQYISIAPRNYGQQRKELPPIPPPSSAAPPTPRADALSRGLSQRYRPPAISGALTFPNIAPLILQPLHIRTRENTRWQGRWLRYGTLRIDPKERRRDEKDERKMLRKIEKDLENEARKARKVRVEEI